MLENAGLLATAGLVAGGAALLAARLAVFRAGCALADAGEPGLPKSFALAAVGLAASAGLAAVCAPLLGRLDADPSVPFGPARALGAALGLLGGAAAGAAIYAAALPTSLRKGALVAALEVLLGALLASLACAAVLVALAVAQISRRPEASPKASAPAALSARPAGPAVPS